MIPILAQKTCAKSKELLQILQGMHGTFANTLLFVKQFFKKSVDLIIYVTVKFSKYTRMLTFHTWCFFRRTNTWLNITFLFNFSIYFMKYFRLEIYGPLVFNSSSILDVNSYIFSLFSIVFNKKTKICLYSQY